MKRCTVKETLAMTAPVDDITVCGWVRTRRDAKGFSFLEINDGSCLKNVQVIVDEASPAYERIRDATTGASVEVKGSLVESPGKGQAMEVRARELCVLGTADPETFPLQKKRHSDEFLRGIAHLRPRTNKFGAAFRIRSEAAFAVHAYFREHGFYYVHTPILTGSDCEGAGEMFRVTTLPLDASKDSAADPHHPFAEDFFGREASLTVSGQLEAESLIMGLGRVYTFGPTFRAENSNTPRHAAEFWMVEPEMAFADLGDDMDLAEGLTRHVVEHVLAHCGPDVELFNRFVDTDLVARLENLVKKPFGRLSYTEAVHILEKAPVQFEYPVGFGKDLQTEHERYLSEEYAHGPVIVYDYPKDIKAFYMRQNDDGATVAAMDMLVPRIGELAGGSQREERLEVLEARLEELGRKVEEYAWYLDLRRFGSVPHAGFGLGFERLVMMLTGILNIRDVLPFPRTPGSLEF